jgi:hypothetical protein
MQLEPLPFLRAGTCSMARKNKNQPGMETCSIFQGIKEGTCYRFARKANLGLELVQLARKTRKRGGISLNL